MILLMQKATFKIHEKLQYKFLHLIYGLVHNIVTKYRLKITCRFLSIEIVIELLMSRHNLSCLIYEVRKDRLTKF